MKKLFQKGLLCIGYDVENGNPKITGKFLKEMLRIHEEYSAPCTLFITGQNFEKNWEVYNGLKDHPLIDLQQHTYSHLILKKITMYSDGKIFTYGENEPLEKIRENVAKASALFRDKIGHEVTGMTTPYAFYRGLMDNPDILKVLYEEGIRFIRSYGRNDKSFCPVPLEIQPFFYEEQGFPEFLECPVLGWQDCIWRDRYGWNAKWENRVILDLEHCVENNLYYGYVQHDWSSIRKDRKMKRTEAIIKYARDRNMNIQHYQDLYTDMMKKRGDSQ
jgi:peptidoglycan/xylan/chitin deacetylase (PgdA/CDA1 family)